MDGRKFKVRSYSIGRVKRVKMTFKNVGLASSVDFRVRPGNYYSLKLVRRLAIWTMNQDRE